MQDHPSSVHTEGHEILADSPTPSRVSPRHLTKLDRALRIAAKENPDHDPPFGIWLCGESGSGKSALVAAAKHLISDPRALFVQGEAFCGTSEILEPILRAARTLLEELQSRSSEDTEFAGAWNKVVEKHAPALSRVLPEVEWGREIAMYPDLDPQCERNRLFDHLAGVFLRAGEITPVVLHLEGAEHLDDLSLDFLSTLAHVVRSRRVARRSGVAMPQVRLTVVASTHEEFKNPLNLPDGEVMQMVLSGLGRDEFALWLEREYQEEIPLSLREKLYQQSHGNPLDIDFRIRQERQRFDQGTAVQRVKRLIDYGAYAIEVARHVRRLSEPARKALNVLAISGKPISVSLLDRVAGLEVSSPDDSLVPALLEAGWIRQDRQGAIGLAHDRMQEPIVESIGRTECRRLHQAFAEAVEGEHRDRVHRRVREVYYHRRLAEDTAELVPAGFRAADECLRLYDFDGAREVYQSLLKVLSEGEVEPLVRGVTALAEVLVESSQSELTLIEEIERAVGRRRRDIDRESLAGVLRRVGRVAGRWGMTEKELDLYTQAFEVIRHDEQSLERMKIYACLARTSLERQRFDDTMEYCEQGWQASEESDLDSDPEFLELCRVTEEVHFRRGEFVEARSFEEKYLNLADQQGSPIEIIESLFRLAFLHEQGGDLIAAEESLRRCLPIAERTGSRLLLARACERLGLLNQRRGSWDSAHEQLRDAFQIQQEIGTEARQAQLLASLAVTCFFVTKEADGARFLRSYAEHVSKRTEVESRDAPGLPSHYQSRSERDDSIRLRQRDLLSVRDEEAVRIHLELVDLLRDRGELASARSTARRGLRDADRLGGDWGPEFALRLGILARWNGEVEAALTHFQTGLDQMPPRSNRDILAEINIQVGLLQQSRGELTRSRLSLLRGLRQYLEIGHTVGVAHALVHLGETYLLLGRAQVAEELGRSALIVAQGLGIARLEAESRLILGRARSVSGNRNAGLQDANQARALFDQLGILEGRCRALLLAGEIGQRWGQLNEARAHCLEALEIGRDLGLSALIARGLALRGAIEGDRRATASELPRAVRTLESALEHAQALRDRHLELQVLGTFARLYHTRQRSAAAKAHLKRAKSVLLKLAQDSPAECRKSIINTQAVADLLRVYDESGKRAATAG